MRGVSDSPLHCLSIIMRGEEEEQASSPTTVNERGARERLETHQAVERSAGEPKAKAKAECRPRFASNTCV